MCTGCRGGKDVREFRVVGSPGWTVNGMKLYVKNLVYNCPADG